MRHCWSQQAVGVSLGKLKLGTHVKNVITHCTNKTDLPSQL